MLHEVIAQSVAKKTAKLTTAEIKFLRKYLGWSSKDFADAMGVTPTQVSRWESKTIPKPMSSTAERLLRVLALEGNRVDRYPVREFGIQDRAPVRLRMRGVRAGRSASKKVARELAWKLLETR